VEHEIIIFHKLVIVSLYPLCNMFLVTLVINFKVAFLFIAKNF